MQQDSEEIGVLDTKYIGNATNNKHEFIKRLKSICFGTVVNALTVTPFDVLKVRLQSQINLSGKGPSLALHYPIYRTKNIVRFNHEFVRSVEHFDGILVSILLCDFRMLTFRMDSQRYPNRKEFLNCGEE